MPIVDISSRVGRGDNCQNLTGRGVVEEGATVFQRIIIATLVVVSWGIESCRSDAPVSGSSANPKLSTDVSEDRVKPPEKVLEAVDLELPRRIEAKMSDLSQKLYAREEVYDTLADVWMLVLAGKLEPFPPSESSPFSRDQFETLEKLEVSEEDQYAKTWALALTGSREKATRLAKGLETSSFCGNCAASLKLEKMQTLCSIEFLFGDCDAFILSAEALLKRGRGGLADLAPLRVALLSTQKAVCHERDGDVGHMKTAAILAHRSLEEALQMEDGYDWREHDASLTVALAVANQAARLIGKPIPDTLI